MAKLRTISRWLVLALVALVVALILLHQVLAGRAPNHTPGALPTALAPYAAASVPARPVDAHLDPLPAAIRA
jgi:hypothetical protein